MGLITFCRADLWLQWNPKVMTIDASTEGFGVCTGRFRRDLAASTGRVSERSRFRRIGSHAARESALTSVGFREEAGRLLPLDEEDIRDWEMVESFPEVPGSSCGPVTGALTCGVLGKVQSTSPCSKPEPWPWVSGDWRTRCMVGIVVASFWSTIWPWPLLLNDVGVRISGS